ncbi:hypothetical protein [Chitinophaga sp. YIM B06452]|uniref:hypothetical protein n=1 Tax=Chitinophaga sp. YIM B06452 TaxID=3082158 RepID=UPI0031FEF040
MTVDQLQTILVAVVCAIPVVYMLVNLLKILFGKVKYRVTGKSGETAEVKLDGTDTAEEIIRFVDLWLSHQKK